MKRLEAVNDFVIKFANVNGSGSASANELFAKAILRMGVPVSPRNIFPSNIQGLPTWYEDKAAHENRACVFYFCCPLLGIVHRQFQMFRRDFVGDGASFVEIAHLNQRAAIG